MPSPKALGFHFGVAGESLPIFLEYPICLRCVDFDGCGNFVMVDKLLKAVN